MLYTAHPHAVKPISGSWGNYQVHWISVRFYIKLLPKQIPIITCQPNAGYKQISTKQAMRPIQSLIDKRYAAKSAFLQGLTLSVRSRVSSDLADHVWVADIDQNCIIIVTDLAERASMLQYQQHEIIKQINEEFKGKLIRPLRRIKIRVDYKVAIINSIPDTKRTDHSDRIENYKKNCKKLLELINN